MSILPQRARDLESNRLAELEKKVNAQEYRSQAPAVEGKKEFYLHYYMTTCVDGVWGKFVNIIDGTLVGGKVTGAVDASVGMTITIVRGKTSTVFTTVLSKNVLDIDFEDFKLQEDDLILVEAPIEGIHSISLTLGVTK